MSEEKGIGSKFLGLFVEKGTPAEGSEAVEGTGEKTAAELVAELAGQSAGNAPAPATHKGPAGARVPPPQASVAPAMKIPAPSGPVAPANVDFDQVFKQAGMDPSELDRVRKVEELLKALPEGTAAEVKKQFVEASLKAFGQDPAKIVNAAQQQLKALDTYVRLNEQQTAKSLTDMQTQIAQLEEKIIALKVDSEKKSSTLASVSAAADARRTQVRTVLEFFHAPVAPSAAPQK